MTELTTRASSINRALDQIGDKWCLLILQEVFWGIHSFSAILQETGISRGVLSDRLKWLQDHDCLRRRGAGRNTSYHLTRKSVDLYHNALMAVVWEDRYFDTPAIQAVHLVHRSCGKPCTPRMECAHCHRDVDGREVEYHPGPGATRDVRDKKVRRRSSLSVDDVPSARSVYRNLINLIGDRWTANVIALAFHGLHRYEEFHRELPVATNILSDRMRFLVEEGIFETRLYQQRPPRHEYHLTAKGWDLFPWFLTVLQWGDRWCDPSGAGRPMCLEHTACGETLHGRVVCDVCGGELRAHEVDFTIEAAGQGRAR
ncbi:winged helix-turn-helix transcriptional regulator [Parahaliea mediterranea]|uniref:Helix-turn-helix transcriptional regulator n=1 Tax=Parahaliea mediterranea TaxID=651086 RepID=A0A939DI10_9GAMM|nr:winged helix-turn-helix transcriptional regulator [Parahaliea mediterranea]MBN7798221.1 helix-turn-helix transcriptional regulator [Parahaliea mediterranea]